MVDDIVIYQYLLCLDVACGEGQGGPVSKGGSKSTEGRRRQGGMVQLYM